MELAAQPIIDAGQSTNKVSEVSELMSPTLVPPSIYPGPPGVQGVSYWYHIIDAFRTTIAFEKTRNDYSDFVSASIEERTTLITGTSGLPDFF